MQIEDLNDLIRKKAKAQLEADVRAQFKPFRELFSKELHMQFTNNDSKTFQMKPDRSFEHWSVFLSDFEAFVIRKRYEPTVTKAVSDFLKKVEEMHDLVASLEADVANLT